uniref:protein FAM83B-like n=1 Tax=Monopterus albus TaxID=43700 RepID=UPI0009B3AE76|nr:protein FAM83B-like [Monopterus albus]
MESNLSCLSSLKEDDKPVYIQPHYRESYRLAIYALLCGGKEAYEEFLRAEQISHLLSEEEILFILENAELPVVEDDSEETRVTNETGPSTYFPEESDEEVPDLDLGWPEVTLEGTDTSISLLFHPPRLNTPTIKEVLRKQIQEARQVIAIAMDIFTDIDIFKEVISATLRGVVVYILLDHSHFKSFLAMSHRVGVSIQDLKNIRVRTVQGQQYLCQSGVRFHGGLEQKFILVDCRTVLYGTYSYTWSYEKINLSMVLVITGQLVCSYDEEFRRLYARSTVPTVLYREKLSVQPLSDTMALHSPRSSQLSLHQIHMRSRVTHNVRSAQDVNNCIVLTRGLSMQERLHQSHYPDMGNLMRGHSYGGELQKLNSMTRLRMGTKDIGGHLAPDWAGSNQRVGDMLLTNRLSQQQLRHQSRYGADQNLIPFNSETSLHRWKMDAYLNKNEMPLDASCDSQSPMTSPYNSNTGLNEHQSQLIHSRSRDIKLRMEETRQKRLSLQEYAILRQSQETLRSIYPTVERPKLMPSLRGPDLRQTVAELVPNTQNGYSLQTSNHKVNELGKESNRREHVLTDGHRSASHYSIKKVPDPKAVQTWPEPLSRTTSAGELDVKLNDPSLKLSYLQSSNLSMQHPRAMESLTEMPEEKECSNTRVNSSDSAALNDGNAMIRNEKSVPKETSVKLSLPAQSQHQDQARRRRGSVGKVANSLGSAAPRERRKSTSSDTENAPKILNTSAGSQHALEAKSNHTQKQREEPALQRSNSMRMKVYSMLSSDEKKTPKGEEKALQRKASMNASGSNQCHEADYSQTSAAEQTKKGQSSSISRSQNSLSSAPETEKPKSPFSRWPSQRSSKRKMKLSAEQDKGSRSTLDDDAAPQTGQERVYSQCEYVDSPDGLPMDKSVAAASMYPSDTGKSSSLNRHDSGFPGYQTHSGTDNKLGRFMQRMGNLINKNK